MVELAGARKNGTASFLTLNLRKPRAPVAPRTEIIPCFLSIVWESTDPSEGPPMSPITQLWEENMESGEVNEGKQRVFHGPKTVLQVWAVCALEMPGGQGAMVGLPCCVWLSEHHTGHAVVPPAILQCSTKPPKGY